MGRGGAGPRPGRGEADPRLDRLRRLPLVPRDGARVLRGPRGRGADERALRLHQGRPRGAPGRRRDLHGRRPGHDGPGRLAAQRLPHPRRACPTTPAPTSRPSRATACRRGRRWSSGSRTPSSSSAPRSRRWASGCSRGSPARRTCRPPRASIDPAALDAAVVVLQRGYDQEHGGFTQSAPKFPAASSIEFLLRRGERRMALHTLRAMASGGMYDQVGGGFSRYSVDAQLGHPPLREDALRQRAARPRVPARLPGLGRAVLRARVHRDARLGAARPAPGGGRLRLGARRRLRGRSRGSSTSGRPTRCGRCWATDADAAIAAFGLDGPPNFEGRWAPVRATSDPGGAARDQGAAARRRASSACGRRSTTSA